MKIVVVGGGGHARSVLDALRTDPRGFEPFACTDPDPLLRSGDLDGVPIVGDDEVLAELLAEGVTGACLGIGGIGDNGPRAELYERVLALGFEMPSVAHGFAHVAASAKLGRASVVLAGAILAAGATVGEDVIVGSGALVEHDSDIGEHVHLASGCVLGGAVVVGPRAHVGLGARILQGRTIGEGAIVGAGALVIHDVPPWETVMGSPAVARSVT